MFEKPVYQSKTIWGAIAMLAGAALSRYGITLESAELESVISAALVLSGFIVTLYGRITAAVPIRKFFGE